MIAGRLSAVRDSSSLWSFLAGMAALAFSPSLAPAEVWAYTDYAPAGTLQPWTGNLGLDFVVNQSTFVTALGAFNSTGSGTFVNNIRVGIFDMAGSLHGSVATFEGGTNYSFVPGSNDVYRAVAAFLLNPGTYSVVALGYGFGDYNGNTGNGSTPPSLMNDGGGIIAFVGSARYDYESVNLQLPGVVDGGPANRYNAGTFQYTTPEPGSFILLGSGLVLLMRKP
jgi:hypothetical protein